MRSENKGRKIDRPKLKKINTTGTILWRYFAFFAFGIILIISIVFFGILGGTGFTRTRDKINDIGDGLAAVLCDDRLSPMEKEIKVTSQAYEEGVYLFVFDINGNNLLSTESYNREILSTAWEEVLTKVSEWEKDASFGYNVKKGNRTTFNYVACVTFNGERAIMLVRYPITSVAASLSQMELTMLILGLAALVIAFFVSYSLADKLSSPLRDISGTAQKLASGDYSVQFNSAQYTEIAKLSDSLNYMKDEMKKSDEFQKELIANVSHDLKTPLTMIKAYASMIKEISGDDRGKREKHLSVIIDEADRLTGLVNDILITSKISSGMEQLNKKVFNLTEQLYSVINKFVYLQETQGYKLMVDVQPNLYTLADEEKIYQVMYNLVSNGVNYTGEDKTVYISLKHDVKTSRIKFIVRDTGKGIDEEELAHIWDRYYRSKDNHLRPVKGTGLGLNIVKTILKNHSFNFGVDTKKGEGSSFYIDFPVVSSNPETGVAERGADDQA